MARVVLVIPCYNEARRLSPEEFGDFQAAGHTVEFCFVNDGSTDGTLDILRALTANRPATCTHIDLPHNRGKAEAVRQGLVAAIARGPQYVGFWDADLATPLDELPTFIEVLDDDSRRQMVLGARVQLMGRSIERAALRHYMGRVFATAVSLALHLPVYDTQCGAKLFRVTPVLERIVAEPFRARWIFDVEILARFIRLSGGETVGASIYEQPLRRWRDVAGSKLKATDFIKAAGDLWRIRRAYVRAGS